MDGSIEVDAEKCEGTRFTTWLPAENLDRWVLCLGPVLILTRSVRASTGAQASGASPVPKRPSCPVSPKAMFGHAGTVPYTSAGPILSPSTSDS